MVVLLKEREMNEWEKWVNENECELVSKQENEWTNEWTNNTLLLLSLLIMHTVSFYDYWTGLRRISELIP